MTYTVTITSPDGKKDIHACGGSSDQEAIIYAGKVVEEHAAQADPDASVTIEKDGKEIGVPATVRDMTTKSV